MAQADGVVANGTGSAVRADINGQLAALFTNHSGSTEPATTFAFQTWADTNTSTLKLRNSSNDGWIQLARLDGQFDAKTFNGNITLNAQSDLRLADSDSSNWVAFQAPATVASNLTWTLPATDGTSGQALTTNGSGTLSWTSPAASTDIISEGNTSAEVVDTGSDGHFKVTTEGTEALRVDASQRLLVGTSTNNNNTRLGQKVGVVTVDSSTFGGINLTSYTGTTAINAPLLDFQRSRGTTDGSFTKIESGDRLGGIAFRGSDGSQFVDGALILAVADGTTGASDLPSRLEFYTTADGASSSTERLRIAQSGAFGLSGANYGTSGQVLSSQGSGSPPQWATVTSSKVFAHMAFDSNQSLNPGGYNVSSVTNNATGKNTVNFTTSHGSTNYSVLCSGCRLIGGTSSMSISYGNMANGSVDIFSAGPVGTYLDLADTSVCILT